MLLTSLASDEEFQRDLGTIIPLPRTYGNSGVRGDYITWEM